MNENSVAAPVISVSRMASAIEASSSRIRGAKPAGLDTDVVAEQFDGAGVQVQSLAAIVDQRGGETEPFEAVREAARAGARSIGARAKFVCGAAGAARGANSSTEVPIRD